MNALEFKNAILAKQNKYHIHHPFHIRMNSGGCTKEEIQVWVANRYYYQEMIPRKDAAILMNCPDSEIRKEWIKRIEDHDSGGGIDAWVSLGLSVGLTKEILESHSMLLPGVKFAVDAYYHFCKDSNYHDAMTSSLTELFAPEIHQVRLDNWPVYYPWIDQPGYNYFRKRLGEAKRDVNFTLDYAVNHYITPKEQLHASGIIDFKLNVLWCMLDSISIECEKIK
jgi:pyrroloquinoline-quinone synthase